MKQIRQTSLLFITLIAMSIGNTFAQNKQSYTQHAPTAHHQVALEVLEASQRWIQAFNQGNAQVCGSAYQGKSAVMRAKPFGVKQGSVAITAFWASLVKQGAAQLEYTQVAIQVVNKHTVLLSANWRMNIGEGKIYQEKWIKEKGKWYLAYDDFEVLKKYAQPAKYTPSLASHHTLTTAIKASMQWVASFNQQNAMDCAKAYLPNATMNATPFASVHTQAAVQQFWAKLIKDGARNLVYHQLKVVATTSNLVQLSAHWSMNIGEGKIYQEKWVKEGNQWKLGYDEFEVLQKYQ